MMIMMTGCSGPPAVLVYCPILIQPRAGCTTILEAMWFDEVLVTATELQYTKLQGRFNFVTHGY
jgi:hypothetical protein